MFPPLNSYFTEKKSHWVPLNNVLKVFVCLNINFDWLSEIRLFPFPAFFCGYVICCSRNIYNPALRAHFVYQPPPPPPPPLPTVWSSILASQYLRKRPLSPTPLNFQWPTILLFMVTMSIQFNVYYCRARLWKQWPGKSIFITLY